MRTRGTSVVADGAVDLDLDFSEVVDILDFALSARGEAWNGNWGIIADYYTVDIGLGSGVGLPGLAGGSADVNVDVSQPWASLLAAYRFAQGTNGDRGFRFARDVSAGVRWNRIKQEIDAEASVHIGPGLGQQSRWAEPRSGGSR